MPDFQGFLLVSPLFRGNCTKLGLGTPKKGQHCFQLPQLSWEQPPMSRVPHSTRAGLFQPMAVPTPHPLHKCPWFHVLCH